MVPPRSLAGRLPGGQIESVPMSLPPYALSVPIFRFRHLALFAGRAPIGGAREVALACFVAARLAVDCAAPMAEDREGRSVRSAAANAWLGTLALPTSMRTLLTRCVEASVAGVPAAVGHELAGLAAAAAPFLDAPSCGELDALAASLRG